MSHFPVGDSETPLRTAVTSADLLAGWRAMPVEKRALLNDYGRRKVTTLPAKAEAFREAIRLLFREHERGLFWDTYYQGYVTARWNADKERDLAAAVEVQ